MEEHPPIVLIANKCDLTSNDQAERLVSLTSEFGNAPFMRTSAKEMVNIPAAFHQLVREIRSSRDGVAADRPSPVESALASNHFVSTPRSSASEDLDLEFPSTLSSTSTCTERPAIFPSTDLSDRSSPAPAPHPKPRTRPARHEPQQHLPKRRKKPKRKCVVM
ncbi:Ras-like protein 1 [Diplonema papillatum]|nr:Ras-like protein 1 [Diplonema papillatum]